MLSTVSTRHPSLSPGDDLAFLHRAAHDPRFRASLETNPRAALAEYGLSVEADQIPSKVTPPSAESILDVLVDVESDDQDRRSNRLPWAPWLGSA